MKIATIIITFFFGLSLVSCSQTKNANVPNKTAKKEQKKPKHVPTKDALVRDVKKYILKEQKKNDGFFIVYDSIKKKSLQLKLEKVHQEKFSKMGDGVYFDCANFRGEDGKLYDIDIFMKWNGRKFKSNSKRMVHKVDGKPRYVWYEKEGVWKTKEPKPEEPDSVDGHPAH